MSTANDPVLQALQDALIEHPEPGEPIYADATQWPAWTDLDVAALNAPRGRDECFSDEAGYEPTAEDWEELLDLEERLLYERG